MYKKLINTAGWRLVIILILGFASGLPLALTGQSLQAWLTLDNINMSTIGFFSLVGLPYTFKFLWAPLMDRFEPPFFGRRRGWLIITQLFLAASLFAISQFTPSLNTQALALVAVCIAFFSASQDVVIDAYRTDVLTSEERGLGSSLTVLGYRLAMIVSGGLAFIWADTVTGNGWSWPHIYQIMALIMLVVAAISFLFLPSVAANNVAPKTNAKNDLIGFFAVVVAVVVGYHFTVYAANPFSEKMFSLFFKPLEDGTVNPLSKKWADMFALILGIVFTVPLAWWASQKAKFETLNISLKNYFSMKGAVSFLALIILYKLGDAFAGSLLTPFLLKGVGFAQAEIGVVNKVIGIWLTIVGAIIGGGLMMKLGLYRSLFAFGVLQLISNLGFWLVAYLGKGAWGAFTLPAFDLLIVTLKEASSVDYLLLFAIATENITGGMGTAAFVAFLMALCNQKFSATQFALLSAFSAVGRVWVGPLAGVLTESVGWQSFFIFSTFAAAPGMYMLYHLRDIVKSLETPKVSALADD